MASSEGAILSNEEVIRRDGSFIIKVLHSHIQGVALEFKTGLPHCCDLDLEELRAKGIYPKRIRIGLAYCPDLLDSQLTTWDDDATNLALLMNGFCASLHNGNYQIDLTPGISGLVLKHFSFLDLPLVSEEGYHKAMTDKYGSFGRSPQYVADMLEKVRKAKRYSDFSNLLFEPREPALCNK